jgi:hypothetical protein
MAQRDYIKVDPSQTAATKARMLIDFKDAVARVLMLGPPLLLIMNENFDDSNPGNIIWTDLEALFGLPAGGGHTVFDMINGSMGAAQGTMQNSQMVNLISRVG